jgi:hypothetical protein
MARTGVSQSGSFYVSGGRETPSPGVARNVNGLIIVRIRKTTLGYKHAIYLKKYFIINVIRIL